MQESVAREMCYQHGQDVTPQSDLEEIMGFDSSMLKLVLESFVDEVAEESAELILERPRFVHAVVVVAGEEEEPFCQASCIRQLDKIEVQEPVQAAIPEEDDAIQRALRELIESRAMLGYKAESEPSSPTKTITKQQNHCMHTTTDLLHELNNTTMYVRQTAVQFPSMTRSRGQV